MILLAYYVLSLMCLVHQCTLWCLLGCIFMHSFEFENAFTGAVTTYWSYKRPLKTELLNCWYSSASLRLPADCWLWICMSLKIKHMNNNFGYFRTCNLGLGWCSLPSQMQCKQPLLRESTPTSNYISQNIIRFSYIMKRVSFNHTQVGVDNANQWWVCVCRPMLVTHTHPCVLPSPPTL